MVSNIIVRILFAPKVNDLIAINGNLDFLAVSLAAYEVFYFFHNQILSTIYANNMHQVGHFLLNGIEHTTPSYVLFWSLPALARDCPASSVWDNGLLNPF